MEKKPVLLRPMVVVAPAFSEVIHADPAPSVLVLIVPVLEIVTAVRRFVLTVSALIKEGITPIPPVPLVAALPPTFNHFPGNPA